MQKILILIFPLFVILSCETRCPMISTVLDSSQTLCDNCQSPNIYKVDEHNAIVSYIETLGDSIDVLYIRKLNNEVLSDPIEVSRGNNWFVNWADIPAVTVMNNDPNILMAHWLQMKAEGTYDYDIRCSISKDAGSTWGESFVLHDDGVAAEHGFVSLISTKEGAFVTWLDGRNTKTEMPSHKSDIHGERDNHNDHGHGAGNMPMTLRAAWIDKNGQKSNELEVDDKVCDCCQTDAVLTPNGPVIVYRDRSDSEIRDILCARYVKDAWVTNPIHIDNWKIAGCPVNGPAIAHNQGLLAVVWYTQMNNVSKVYLTVSRD